VCMVLGQAVLVKPFIARFGERISLWFGLLAGTVGFAIYGLASRGWMFWIGIPVMALWGLGNPALQGMMSRKVSPLHQGQLQGAAGSIRGISGLLGPTLFTQVFALFIGDRAPFSLPGAPFLLASLLLALSLLVALAGTRRAPG
jgi:MFS transporter, DHA1 family, tetracycline resistance protein